MSLSENIKRLRIEKGYTMQNLSDLSGVSRAHICWIERRRTQKPGALVLHNLAGALGVSVEYLLNDKEKEIKMDKRLILFKFDHLKGDLRDASKLFYDLAQKLVSEIPDNVERSAGLRKLLESKDCIVRAVAFKDEI